MTAVAELIEAPTYDVDFYSDELLADPYTHYRAMRDLAPAVWLPRNQGYAITRFADVRAALRNDTVFVSGRGVMMNDLVNEASSGSSVLVMDDPDHAERRRILMKPLSPAALKALNDEIQTLADALVDRLVARGRCDGVVDLAHYLPLTIVARLVGLPEDGQGQMLHWANGIFNVMGGVNERYEKGLPARSMAMEYLARLRPEDVLPDSWAARLFQLVDEGVLTDLQARTTMFDYVAPALDTTINGTTGALLLFATNPDQWDLVRADRSLIPAAIAEALRLETPVRAFSRYVAEDADVDGVAIPGGSRALIVYASANRDERRWEDAERFDVRRRAPQEQLAFGTGVHMCAGMHLAQLEMRCLFDALARKVARISVGSVGRELHNVLHGLSSMELTLSAHDAFG